MRNSAIAIVVLAGLGGGTLLWVASRPKAEKPRTAPPAAVAATPKSDRALLHAEEAKAPVPTPTVAAARLHEGHRAAESGDWKAARAQFLLAAKAPAPKEAVGPFGSLSDQGLYQAAATLAGEGRDHEAKRAFLSFIKDRPGSPLVHAAKKRVDRFGDEAASAEAGRLLQIAVARQEKRIRFETSVCGPKAIAYLLPGFGKEKADYKTLARECGTTDSGTTVEGLRKGLAKHGVESWAYRLNRADLLAAPLPAIALLGDHYIVVERADERTIAFYDPSTGRTERRAAPPETAVDFSVDAVLFRQPELHP